MKKFQKKHQVDQEREKPQNLGCSDGLKLKFSSLIKIVLIFFFIELSYEIGKKYLETFFLESSYLNF